LRDCRGKLTQRAVSKEFRDVTFPLESAVAFQPPRDVMAMCDVITATTADHAVPVVCSLEPGVVR